MLSRSGRSGERALILQIFILASTAEPENGATALGTPVQDKSLMSADSSHLLICSCERTMPLDAQAIGRGRAGRITQANQLCGQELERCKQALPVGIPVTVACTQEAPLFLEVGENFPQSQLT